MNPRIPEPGDWIDALPPVVRAATRGDAEQVAALLRAGSSPMEADEEGWTALHAAAAFNYPTVVALLLEAGADVNVRDNEGFTPLLNAARAGPEVIRALLRAGADPMVQESGTGLRPLHRFAGYGNAAAIELLLEAGVDVDARTFRRSGGVVVETGMTALMDAAESGYGTCVELLLRAGANRWLTDEGQTAADMAAARGHEGIARLLAV